MAYEISTYRKIADSSLELQIFGFGSAHLGEMYGVVDEAASQATLNAAWAAGVRYYDTAPWYGRGLAEHRLGGFLRTQKRSEFQITTKVGRTLHRPNKPTDFDRTPWKGGLNFDVHFDYSYTGIMRSYEQAMQRLALDTIDALLIHDLDAGAHSQDQVIHHQNALTSSGMKALDELKSTGDIQSYGMGINTDEALNYATSALQLDFLLVAMPYTLLDQASLHTGMADCVKSNTSVIIGAPLASGILATGVRGKGKYNYQTAPEAVLKKVHDIETVCQTHNVSLTAAALQFPLAHPAVCSIIPGAVNADQIRQNIALVESPIPDAFWADLKNQNLLVIDAPTPSADKRD
ncbi:hypothetical protein AB833_00300 [Chromatiales bacterium (ex Bugula neritina AB1)]|nr:hypothetical protein AB833_00300 [Chromatiales bacterium (ex Bugula neritina AB1)]